ncbi:MAG: hypothetical protein N2045_13865 [Fimbriimonadales bacterium]|nr:hypothetical protein [Fimbriimonadales bacterium]
MRNLYKRVTFKVEQDSPHGEAPTMREVATYTAHVLPPSASSTQIGIARGQNVIYSVVLPLGACSDVKSAWLCIDGRDYRVLSVRQTFDHELVEVGHER